MRNPVSDREKFSGFTTLFMILLRIISRQKMGANYTPGKIAYGGKSRL